MAIITVSQLNNYIKRYIDRNVHLSDLWIKAEISNLNNHYSGHIYMTLKDESASMRAVIFRAYSDKLKFRLKDGMKVIAYGKVSVYERDGTYQLYVESLIPDGLGELYSAYTELKERLSTEGIFDDIYKKPLPKFPKSIGIVSSLSGAALRDVMNVISRRYPMCDICIYPTKVQGVGSVENICDGLRFFSDKKDCDVVILARGGGSIEDLWSFNDERTAYAIFNCTKPVVCGVGHETDYTIADFVSDVRAPTPSAAAELATPSAQELKARIGEIKGYIDLLISQIINNAQNSYEAYSADVLHDIIDSNLEKKSIEINLLNYKLAKLFSDFSGYANSKIASLTASLNSLNPIKVLERGYSILTDDEGNSINTANIKTGDILNIFFHKGKAKCNITEVEHGEK